MGFFKFRAVSARPDEFVNGGGKNHAEIRLSSSWEIYLPMFFMTSAVREHFQED